MCGIMQMFEKVKASRKLEYSPVAYMTELLEQYLQGGIKLAELAMKMDRQTRDAQFFFSHMPQEHILENQRMFRDEFILADEVYAMLCSRGKATDDAAFRARLETSMEKYLQTLGNEDE